MLSNAILSEDGDILLEAGLTVPIAKCQMQSEIDKTLRQNVGEKACVLFKHLQ